MKDNCNAYTLSEVLVTLGIIGVISAISLFVIKFVQHKQLEVGFNKAYTTLAQAFEMYFAENGEPLKAELLINKGLNNTHIFTKYIKKLKTCGWGSYSSACVSYHSLLYKRYNGHSDASFYLGQFYGPQFIMNDGQLVFIGTAGQSVLIGVDTNGYDKKPNRAGYDVFVFELSSDGKFRAQGQDGTYYSTSKSALCDFGKTNTSSVNGYSCSYYAISDKNYFKNLK